MNLITRITFLGWFFAAGYSCACPAIRVIQIRRGIILHIRKFLAAVTPPNIVVIARHGVYLFMCFNIPPFIYARCINWFFFLNYKIRVCILNKILSLARKHSRTRSIMRLKNMGGFLWARKHNLKKKAFNGFILCIGGFVAVRNAFSHLMCIDIDL